MSRTVFRDRNQGSIWRFTWLPPFNLSDMTQDEAYKLFQDCVKEVQKRLILNLPNFAVQVIDKKGIRRLTDITVKNLPE